MSKKINEHLLDLFEPTPYITRYILLPKRISNILNLLKGYPQSSVFLNKVTKKEAPDYHLIIKNPMDIGTIQKKIGKYESYEEFKKDLDLIWDNCLRYNAGPYFVRCANIMKRAVENSEIERFAVEKDSDYRGYQISVKGMSNKKYLVRYELEKAVCRILKEMDIGSISRNALYLLVDVLGFKIVEELRRE
ncbi:hypothetical protein P3W45_001775 [Vairimorpha bombi]|jgi:hypothetical protein